MTASTCFHLHSLLHCHTNPIVHFSTTYGFQSLHNSLFATHCIDSNHQKVTLSQPKNKIQQCNASQIAVCCYTNPSNKRNVFFHWWINPHFFFYPHYHSLAKYVPQHKLTINHQYIAKSIRNCCRLLCQSYCNDMPKWLRYNPSWNKVTTVFVRQYIPSIN